MPLVAVYCTREQGKRRDDGGGVHLLTCRDIQGSRWLQGDTSESENVRGGEEEEGWSLALEAEN